MSAPGVAKLKRVSRWVAKRLTDRAAVLLYHQVAQKDPDPWSLAVSPRNFAEQLEVLQRHAQPLTLGSLANAHRAGAVPSRAVAITFDDGYANNLYDAKPALEKFGIPATVFVATGYVDGTREYWWEELDQLLLGPAPLPERLRLEIRGAAREWEVGATSRPDLYFSVWRELQPLRAVERLRILQDISAWAGIAPAARPAHRPMNAPELRLLEQGGLVEIGAHTVTHPLLTAHSGAVQQQEITQSKLDLEEVLGHTVRSFSYPFGAFGPDTVRLVRDAGFDCALSTVSETVWSRSDRFELPRFSVPDCGGQEFERLLSQWLNR